MYNLHQRVNIICEKCHMSGLMYSRHLHSLISLTAEYLSNPAEMLQEKLSAVTDECMSRVQSGGETDLLPDQSRLGLSTAPTIPSSSEPDQVHTQAPEPYTDHAVICDIRLYK